MFNTHTGMIRIICTYVKILFYTYTLLYTLDLAKNLVNGIPYFSVACAYFSPNICSFFTIYVQEKFSAAGQ